ncbi:MAG: transcriptional regulator, partial [Rhodobacter sp.]|nr:transcriptional regulator [Rhodobacter sp.]
MSVDLNSMSLKELKELQGQLTKAIASFEDRKKKAALAELEE